MKVLTITVLVIVVAFVLREYIHVDTSIEHCKMILPVNVKFKACAIMSRRSVINIHARMAELTGVNLHFVSANLLFPQSHLKFLLKYNVVQIR